KPVFDLRGSYRFVNDRLHALLGGITPDEVRRLFLVTPVACPVVADPAAELVAAGAAAAVPSALGSWRPAPELLTPGEPDPAFHLAAQQRAGFLVTSYSAVKRLQGGFVPAAAPSDDPATDEEGG